MNTTTPFRRGWSTLMLVLICAAFAGDAAASAGRIDFSIGGVVATRPGGQQRSLVKGDELESGDTVHTNNGRAQIRFPDGAYVSLQPNTVFGIKDYNYDGKPDGSERGFFSLLKGAMRAVTGLIGRVHRNAFQIATPTATVGIRGTGGLIVILPDGSTLIRGSSGIWSLSNASGSIDVPAGTSGLAPANPNEPPHETSETPSVPPAPPGTASSGFIAGDERTDTGDPIIPVVPLQNGNGYAAATASDVSGFSSHVLASTPVDAVFNASGHLIDVIMGPDDHYTLGSRGSTVDFGTDGILAWGRWIGPVSGTYGCEGSCPFDITYNANTGLHYVIGMPTPVMPTTGSAIFTLLGATNPTYLDGRTRPGTFAGSLEVLFGASSTVTTAFSVSMPDGNKYLMNGSTTASGALFSTSSLPVTGAGGTACVASGCASDVRGFFSGANAARAGVAYHINDSNSADIIGAAAFKNTGVPVPTLAK